MAPASWQATTWACIRSCVTIIEFLYCVAIMSLIKVWRDIPLEYKYLENPSLGLGEGTAAAGVRQEAEIFWQYSESPK